MRKSLKELIDGYLEAQSQTQADLGRCIDNSRSYIGKLRDAYSTPDAVGTFDLSLATIRSLAKCMNVSQAEILAAINMISEADLSDPLEMRMMESYRRLPLDMREAVVTIVQTLDKKFSIGGRATKPRFVLSKDDTRDVTDTPISAQELPEQNGEGSNGEEGGRSHG
jgi:hypothetical protein